MQRDLSATWILAAFGAGFLVLATLAEAWCGEIGATAGVGEGEVVYVPNQSFQVYGDPSGRYQTHVRGMVPVYIERD